MSSPWFRKILDALYSLSSVLAALSLIAILSLIIMQMLARWTGEVFPGAPDYVGYFMASASFLAFAGALNNGAHIRVSILLNSVGERARRWVEIWCFAIGTAIGWYFVFYAQKFVYWSWKFNDVSQGQDKMALWIPQSVMLLGAIIFAIALTDNLVNLITKGHHFAHKSISDDGMEEHT